MSEPKAPEQPPLFTFGGEVEKPPKKPRIGKYDLLCADVKGKLDAAGFDKWLCWPLRSKIVARQGAAAIRRMDAGPGMLYRTEIRGPGENVVYVKLVNGERRKRAKPQD